MRFSFFLTFFFLVLFSLLLKDPKILSHKQLCGRHSELRQYSSKPPKTLEKLSSKIIHSILWNYFVPQAIANTENSIIFYNKNNKHKIFNINNLGIVVCVWIKNNYNHIQKWDHFSTVSSCYVLLPCNMSKTGVENVQILQLDVASAHIHVKLNNF